MCVYGWGQQSGDTENHTSVTKYTADLLSEPSNQQWLDVTAGAESDQYITTIIMSHTQDTMIL